MYPRRSLSPPRVSAPSDDARRRAAIVLAAAPAPDHAAHRRDAVDRGLIGAVPPAFSAVLPAGDHRCASLERAFGREPGHTA